MLISSFRLSALFTRIFCFQAIQLIGGDFLEYLIRDTQYIGLFTDFYGIDYVSIGCPFSLNTPLRKPTVALLVLGSCLLPSLLFEIVKYCQIIFVKPKLHLLKFLRHVTFFLQDCCSLNSRFTSAVHTFHFLSVIANHLQPLWHVTVVSIFMRCHCINSHIRII